VAPRRTHWTGQRSSGHGITGSALIGRRLFRRARGGGHEVQDGRWRIGLDDGVIGEDLAAEGADAREIFHGAAVETLGLRLEAEEEFAILRLAIEPA
jgi:hypothetical protein